MDKERVITVIIGLGIGAIIALGYFVFTRLPKPTAPTLQKEEQRPLPPENIIKIGIELNFPDYISTTSSTFEVGGKTTPGIPVLIFANSDEKIASSDAMGNFSEKIKLEDGDNALSVTTLTKTIDPIVIYRHVIFEIP